MDNLRRRINGSKSIFDQNGRAIIDGYEVVNLELPSGKLWETCNLGAETETEVGYYYQGTSAAQYNYSYGGKSFVPSTYEIQELIDNTTHSVVTINGVTCIKLVSIQNPNAYMIVPFSGYKLMANGNIYSLDTRCYFWSSIPASASGGNYLHCFQGSSTNYVSVSYVDEKTLGLPIRRCILLK